MEVQTWIGGGDGGGAAEGAGGGIVGPPALVIAVDGVGSVCGQSVGQIAEAGRLNGGAVGAGAACVVQSSLHNLLARVAPHHTPRRCRCGDAGADQQQRHRFQCQHRCCHRWLK